MIIFIIHAKRVPFFSLQKFHCRSYDERKDMYDVGVDLVRPKMLENVWQVRL